MIIEFVFNAISGVLTAIFSVLPSLPPMPSQIVDAGNWFVDMVSHATGFFKFIYGGVFFNVIITLLIALLAFEQLFHVTMWILKKIPSLNIK